MFPDFSLQTICDVFGKTRQAHYKREKRREFLVMQQAMVVKLVEEIRVELPRIGGRKLYHLLKKPLLEHGIDIGRDKLFFILSECGLLVKKRRRRKPITTDSDHPFYKYPNLIKELTILYPNQVWVSDITYISLAPGFCYLSLITDAYSRRIVGYSLWRNLSKEGPLNALKMAIAQLEGKRSSPMIHHSDRGLQYCCADYIRILELNCIAISMTLNGDPYENAQAERVNGILKTEFNLDRGFRSFEIALESVTRAIQSYNFARPHASCNYLTPDEAYSLNGEIKKRWKHYNKKQSVPLAELKETHILQL